jgi:hypothetical protein
MLKRFHFERIEDVSGTSGCGKVAEGCVFPTGEVVVYWCGTHSSINVYRSLSDVEWIHSHQGKTKIIWDDPPTEDKKTEK